MHYHHEFTVSADAIDRNGHVNNVIYVQWMQDLAVRHFAALGGTAITSAAGCTWVVRSHHIEYLVPAFADERIMATTWIDSFQKVRSLRKYEFTRSTDSKLLVRGQTDWVYIDQQTLRPRSIPAEIRALAHP